MNPIVATIRKLQGSLASNPDIPETLRIRALEQLARSVMAIQYGGGGSNLEITEKFVDFACRLPWKTQSPDVLDLVKAQEVMDSHHYGLPKVKERIMQYLASIILIKQKNKQAILRAPSLFFTGLAGTGKTSFAHIIAESLGRKFYRISFGGLANVLDLRGHSKTTPYAQPGFILRALAECGTRNPVIILDEMDRVNPEERSAIMGALLEILDPSQNYQFHDYFLDYPFDLSQVMFVATANNTNDIATAVLDRLEVIQMPSYTDDEKIMIGKKFVLPKQLSLAGLDMSQLQIGDDVWPKLVRPLGFEPGIRSLERLIESITRKVALQIVSGNLQVVSLNEGNMFQYVDMTLASSN